MDEIRENLSNRLSRIKNRCYNPNNKKYYNYGGRGITVCDEWLNGKNGKSGFECFYEWSMNNGFVLGLAIDRINNDLGYSPDNCRYVDVKTQCNNTRVNVYIEYKSRTQTLMQWCEELNLDYDVIRHRIKGQDWPIEKAFTTPTRKKSVLYTYKGKEYTLPKLAKLLNVPLSSLRGRINQGLSVEEAVKIPKKPVFTINNETKSFKDWCKTTGIKLNTAWGRYYKGFPLELSILNISFNELEKKFKEYLKEHPNYNKEKEKELRPHK